MEEMPSGCAGEVLLNPKVRYLRKSSRSYCHQRSKPQVSLPGRKTDEQCEKAMRVLDISLRDNEGSRPQMRPQSSLQVKYMQVQCKVQYTK